MVYSSLEINEPGYIYRNKDTILKTKNKIKDKELLFEIKFDEKLNYELNFNNYDLDKNGIIKTKNSAWFALIRNRMDDDADLNRYELKEGDIIRIGRLHLRLKIIKIQKFENNKNLNTSSSVNNINKIRISTNNENNNNNNFNNISINTELNLQEIQVNSPISRKRSKIRSSNFKSINSAPIKEEKKEMICRICYGDENEDENPLVQPCNCHGSMKYIHLNCLKQWLKTNTFILQESNELSKVFKIKKAECELCRTELPNFIRHKGKLYEIIDFGNDFKNYVVFENLIEDNKNKNKYLYIISLDNNNLLFNIGRGHDCNLILNDASVSRNHCALRYYNKKLFLEDCSSKFGTLVLIYVKSLKLIEELKLYVQIGISFIRCEVKKPYSFFGCCNISEANNFDYYYKQNKIKAEDMFKMTVKTEMNDDETESINDNEDEKNKNMIEESNDDIKTLKVNKNSIKIMGEDNLITNLDIYGSPVKLKVISECIDENVNEINNSVNNNIDKIEIYEERKNN